MGKLVNLSMFRGYVNKVLPTVYDDSLSYYEVLAKVMEKINEIINLDNAQNEIINNIPEDVSEFAEDLAQFKSSMTQQFNDFKTEINADFDAFEDEVNAKIAADTTPTQGSTKLITSGGVYASLQDIINSLVKDARPTEDSTNYVTSGGVWKAINDAVEALEATLATKQNALTWDTTPTANSTNPVQSGGIKTYVDNAAQGVQDNLDTYITNNNSRVSGIEGDITDLETGKQDALTFDLAPTLGSNNPVTSNGIAQAIAGVTPSIEVDPVPTQGSTNPVSSNGVYVAVSDLETELEEGLADKQDTLTWDTTPTKNSQNPVTSGGLFEKFAQIDPYGTVDPEPEQGSPNAVSSGGTWTALQTLNNDLTAAINTKQDTLTFDSVPTEDSENPVTSNGIYEAIQYINRQISYYVAGQGKINSIINRTYQGEDLTVMFANEIQADYDNPWQWITARTAANNFNGINIGDFIPITIKTSTLNIQIAGIKTYTRYGDTSVEKHIDWISKELYPENHAVNKVNFNNGTAAQNHPWLASDMYHWLNSLSGTVPNEAVVGGGAGEAVDYTADGVYYNLPTELKSAIIEKRFLLPTRYSASELLSDNNDWGWVNLGKLWLPDECEVYGVPVWGSKGGYSIGGSGLQYPIFAGNMNRLKYRNGSRYNWWLLSPCEGYSSHWCGVASDGPCSSFYASTANIDCPVCFRTGETYTT